MRALLDANVLYPTVLRQILTGVAAAGLYEPLWSDRILEEWARATVKLGPEAERQARSEVAGLRAAFPAALVPPDAALAARLRLPDPDDVHVLAAAISGGAEVIVTRNATDFPRATLAAEGIERLDADQFLTALWSGTPEVVAGVCQRVRAEAERLSGEPWEMRALLKRAGLPKLGKRLG
jgi:predicted nucleic acid-binding protein